MVFPRKDFSIGEIKNLSNHKYICNDYSISQRLFMKKLFILAQKRISTKISPNQITITGLFSMISSFLLTFAFNRELTDQCFFLVLANVTFLIFYFFADGVDGIHARETRTCSPLGYMLDHGVDSLVCLFITIGLASTLRIGMGTTFLLLVLNIYVVFYLGALQHKYTGIFVFNYISGCSEGIILVISIHLASFFTEWPIHFLNGKCTLFGIAVSSNILHTIMLITLCYNILEFLFVVLKSLPSHRYKAFMTSLYISVTLFIIFIPAYISMKHDYVLYSWALLVVFACSFSLCYIEETLSIVLDKEVDYRVFVSCYGLLIAYSLITKIPGNFGFAIIMTVCAANWLFFVRTSSIIRNICKRLGTPFISSNKQ